MGTSPRWTDELLSSAPRVMVEAEFYPLRELTMGMAPAQHRQACVGGHLTRLAGVEVVAGSRCRIACCHTVCASSRPDRIGGLGHGARSADGRRSALHVALVSQLRRAHFRKQAGSR